MLPPHPLPQFPLKGQVWVRTKPCGWYSPKSSLRGSPSAFSLPSKTPRGQKKSRRKDNFPTSHPHTALGWDLRVWGLGFGAGGAGLGATLQNQNPKGISLHIPFSVAPKGKPVPGLTQLRAGSCPKNPPVPSLLPRALSCPHPGNRGWKLGTHRQRSRCCRFPFPASYGTSPPAGLNTPELGMAEGTGGGLGCVPSAFGVSRMETPAGMEPWSIILHPQPH